MGLVRKFECVCVCVPLMHILYPQKSSSIQLNVQLLDDLDEEDTDEDY